MVPTGRGHRRNDGIARSLSRRPAAAERTRGHRRDAAVSFASWHREFVAAVVVGQPSPRNRCRVRLLYRLSDGEHGVIDAPPLARRLLLIGSLLAIAALGIGIESSPG